MWVVRGYCEGFATRAKLHAHASTHAMGDDEMTEHVKGGREGDIYES